MDTQGRAAGAWRPGAMPALPAFAQFVVALGQDIVYVALPDAGRALGVTAGSLQWVVSAYASRSAAGWWTGSGRGASS